MEHLKIDMKNKVIVICGPTASGKTTLSIELAKKINGEIVSADSMQIYKDMNIGTAKPTAQEMQGIKHYLLDFISPDERYSVADYKLDAKIAIKKIIEKGKMPIIVGGTGLYIDSLIYEIEYPNIKFDEKYREEFIEKFAETFKKYYENNEIGKDFFKKINKKEFNMLLNDKAGFKKHVDKLVQKAKSKAERRKMFSVNINLSRISIVLFGKHIVEIS